MTHSAAEAWARTFRHAKEHSPFYREWLPDLSDPPPLEQIAPVDKSIVSQRNLDFLAVPRDRVVELVTTTGTTGHPLVWMLSEGDLGRLAFNEQLSFQCAGLTPNDTVLVAVAMDRCFMAGLAYWLGLRALGCTAVRVGPSSPGLVLEMIDRVRPTAIVAVPSFLRIIADKARETGFDLLASPISKAVCIGEPVRDASLSLNIAGRDIEQRWGAQVFSTYGVTELASSLCECQAGQGGHLHHQLLYVEILDDAGQPAAAGQIGEVAATTFGVEAMPIIRYRTGDCAALYTQPCSCGRTTPRLGPILDRKSQRLKFKGVSIYPSTLRLVLEETPEVESFVIVARSESELSDSIEVLVHGSASPNAVRDALQARSKIAPPVRLASRDEIEALQMPPQSRKRRTFVDLR